MSHLRRCFTEKFPVQLVLLLRVKSCETLPNLTYPATTEIVHSLITIVGQQVAEMSGNVELGSIFYKEFNRLSTVGRCETSCTKTVHGRP